MRDVVIIGAGVSGCAIARELSRFALDILVLEKEEDVCCGTSKANSGIVHAGFDAPAGSLMAKLNVAGSRAMEALSQELDFPYRRNGSLVLMTRPDQRDALEALLENGRKNGVEGLEILDRDALLAMEPHLSDEVLAVLYAPTGARSFTWAISLPVKPRMLASPQRIPSFMMTRLPTMGATSD